MVLVYHREFGGQLGIWALPRGVTLEAPRAVIEEAQLQDQGQGRNRGLRRKGGPSEGPPWVPGWRGAPSDTPVPALSLMALGSTGAAAISGAVGVGGT